MAEIQNEFCDTTKPHVLPKHYLQLLQEKREKELLQVSQSISTIPVSSGDTVQGDTSNFPVKDFEKLKIDETPQCYTRECTTQNDSNVPTTLNKQSQSVLDYYGDTNPYEDDSIKSGTTSVTVQNSNMYICCFIHKITLVLSKLLFYIWYCTDMYGID